MRGPKKRVFIFSVGGGFANAQSAMMPVYPSAARLSSHDARQLSVLRIFLHLLADSRKGVEIVTKV